MTRNVHEEAQEWIALAGAQRRYDADEAWLQAHLRECAACRDYADEAASAVRALRSQPLAADSALVRATRMRVRSRALELRRQQERRWVICICCLAVTLGGASTTAMLWGGFAWMGQHVRLPGPFWQIGLVALDLMPAIVAAILMLARGTYMADHNRSLQD